MTDTESKEVEELAKDLKEIRECEIKEHCLLLDGEVAKKLYAKGYTKRPQAKNALVPLDEMKVVETIFTWDEIGALTHTGKKTLARAICSKFAIPAVTAQPKHGKLVEALKEILPFVDGYYEHCKCGRCLAYRKCEQALKEYEQ